MYLDDSRLQEVGDHDIIGKLPQNFLNIYSLCAELINNIVVKVQVKSLDEESPRVGL